MTTYLASPGGLLIALVLSFPDFTEAQRGEATCPWPQNQLLGGVGRELNQALLDSKACGFSQASFLYVLSGHRQALEPNHKTIPDRHLVLSYSRRISDPW